MGETIDPGWLLMMFLLPTILAHVWGTLSGFRLIVLLKNKVLNLMTRKPPKLKFIKFWNFLILINYKN